MTDLDFNKFLSTKMLEVVLNNNVSTMHLKLSTHLLITDKSIQHLDF